MDPLDQRLIDAGAAWRQAQPDVPDLNRLIAGLERRRSRAFPSRLMFVFVAGLLVLSAVAVAPGVGSMLDRFRNGGPVPVAPTSSVSPSATPSEAPSPSPSANPSPAVTPQPSGPEGATALVDRYEAALVAGNWQTAFDLLAPASPTHGMGLTAYASERGPFFDSVAGRYTIGTPTQDVPDWTTYAPLINGADTSRAFLVEVDYPALSGNNAGYEQFVVGPDTSGTWWIWPVR